MAIDLNKMRAKLTALQNRGEKKDSAEVHMTSTKLTGNI